jgi:hypothetical protein
VLLDPGALVCVGSQHLEFFLVLFRCFGRGVFLQFPGPGAGESDLKLLAVRRAQRFRVSTGEIPEVPGSIPGVSME